MYGFYAFSSTGPPSRAYVWAPRDDPLSADLMQQMSSSPETLIASRLRNDGYVR